METKKKSKAIKKTVPKSKAASASKEKPKEVSKLWQAVLRNRGTGKIIDMEAVMK